jgi:hypothetical protein
LSQPSRLALITACLVGWWLMAGAGLFWEKSSWLIAGAWFGLREKYCWLVQGRAQDLGFGYSKFFKVQFFLAA